MIKSIKHLLGLAHREDATTAELAPSLPAAASELTAAQEAQGAAEAAYHTGLLTADDATLRKLVDARTEAGVRVDRATAILGALRERHAEAELREAEAQRVKAYEAALKQASDARRKLTEVYPVLAADLVRLIEIVALAEIEIERINADLPQNAKPLEGVESSARDIAAVPTEIISEEIVERWVKVGEIYPSGFNQSDVYRTSRGRGVVRFPGLPINYCDEVELRRFTERRVVERRGYEAAPRLAATMFLPGFRHRDKEFWKPSDKLSGPRDVLSYLADLKSREQRYDPAPTMFDRLIADADAKPVVAHRQSPSFGARGAT